LENQLFGTNWLFQGPLDKFDWAARKKGIHKEVRNMGIGQLTETLHQDLLRLGESPFRTTVVMKPRLLWLKSRFNHRADYLRL
jgi:hypothetical protein